MNVNTSSNKIKQKDILEKILENMSKSVTTDGDAIVLTKKECLAEITGKTAKEKVEEILKNYDYIFSINAGEAKENAVKAKNQILEYFRKTFGTRPKVNIMLLDKDYIVFVPISFSISFTDPEK